MKHQSLWILGTAGMFFVVVSALFFLNRFNVFSDALPSITLLPQSDETQTIDTNDFTPSEGRARGPGEKGPWINRVALATSKDGETFTATSDVIGDQLDVPDLVYLPNGTLALYMIAWTAGQRSNQLVTAFSSDNGTTWTYHYVTITGLSVRNGGPSPADPDVLVLSDGTIRMYFTYDAKTHYAESTDGKTFTYRGLSFAPTSGMMLDPTVIQIGTMWHLYGGGGPGGDNWHATSADGVTFTQTASVRATGNDGLRYMLSNGITEGNSATVWGFSNDGIDVAQFTTTDGVTFTAQGIALEYTGGMQADHVKDSSVVRLPNGTYLMAYVTAIPE